MDMKIIHTYFLLFFKTDRCPAMYFKRYQRELPTDVAERTPIMNNYQNKYPFSEPKHKRPETCASIFA